MIAAQAGTEGAYVSFQKSAETSHWGLNVAQAALYMFLSLFILLSKSE